MTLEGKIVQKEGEPMKVTIGIIVFIMNFSLSMAMIPFKYGKMVVHKKNVKSRMNYVFTLLIY